MLFGTPERAERPQESLKTAQDAPKTAQEAPKRAPRRPKRPPRRPKRAPRRPQEGPKRGSPNRKSEPSAPRRSQEAPRGPQEAPKRPQEAQKRLQEAQKRLQEASKKPPREPHRFSRNVPNLCGSTPRLSRAKGDAKKLLTPRLPRANGAVKCSKCQGSQERTATYKVRNAKAPKSEGCREPLRNSSVSRSFRSRANPGNGKSEVRVMYVSLGRSP